MWAVWASSVTWFLLEILDRRIEKRRKRKEGREEDHFFNPQPLFKPPESKSYLYNSSDDEMKDWKTGLAPIGPYLFKAFNRRCWRRRAERWAKSLIAKLFRSTFFAIPKSKFGSNTLVYLCKVSRIQARTVNRDLASIEEGEGWKRGPRGHAL